MANDAEIEAVAKAVFRGDFPLASWEAYEIMHETYREEARAAITALDAVREDGWQPIATMHNGGATFLVAWRNRYGEEFVRQEWLGCVSDNAEEHSLTPLAWRPLPAPPKEGTRWSAPPTSTRCGMLPPACINPSAGCRIICAGTQRADTLARPACLRTVTLPPASGGFCDGSS